MCPHARRAPITNNRYCSKCRVSSRKFACVLTQPHLSTMMFGITCVLMLIQRVSSCNFIVYQQHRWCMCPHATVRVIDAVLLIVCPHAKSACVLKVYQQSSLASILTHTLHEDRESITGKVFACVLMHLPWGHTHPFAWGGTQLLSGPRPLWWWSVETK